MRVEPHEKPPHEPIAIIPSSSSKHLKGALTSVTLSEIETLAPAWEQVAMSPAYPEPFFQPYWCIAYARQMGRGQHVRLLTVARGDELRGVLPLVEQRSFFGGIPARTLRGLSGVHSCRYDFVCHRDEQEETVSEAWATLRNDDSWDVIEARSVPQDGAFGGIVRRAAEDGFLTGLWPTHLTPYLEYPRSGSDPFANSPARYKSSRGRLKSSYKKLEELGEPSFEVLSEFDEDLFQSFLNLESSGWKGRAGGSIATRHDLVRFYREALSGASDAGHLRFNVLKLSGRIIAMEFGLQINGRYYSPKITYDESFSRCAPGNLLARYVLTDLFNKGVQRFDFLGPRSRHKSVWGGDVRPHANYYIFRRSLFNSLRYAVAMKVAPRVRQLKYRMYGDPQSLEPRT